MDGDVWFLLGYGLAWVGSGEAGRRAWGVESHAHVVMLRFVSHETVQYLAIAELRLIRGVHCS